MLSSSIECKQINRIMWKAHRRVHKQSKIVHENCKTMKNDDSCKIAWSDWDKRMKLFLSIVRTDFDSCRISLKH